MYTKLQKINEGFTIVETLIVLAIAALIIIIVLIAVPDLQRSSRNTDIQHDAQDVATAVQTYESNNAGALPAAAGNSATAASAGTTAFAPASDGSVYFYENASTLGAISDGHVQASDSIIVATTGGTTNPTVAYSGNTAVSSTRVGPGELLVYFEGECGTTGTTNTGTPNTRGVAIFYPIENSGSGDVACVQA